jgi:vanillate O-demethylase ferredoxin subunit
VLRDAASRGGSAGMHDALQEGDTLIDQRAAQPLPAGARAAHACCSRRHRRHAAAVHGAAAAAIGADFTLHYARARRPHGLPRRDRGVAFAARVHYHHDDGAPAQKLQPAAALAHRMPDTHLYVCGPPATSTSWCRPPQARLARSRSTWSISAPRRRTHRRPRLPGQDRQQRQT